MFDNIANHKIENAAEMIELGEIAGPYRTPELQSAGQATKMVQGWGLSGYDCGSYTFYYRAAC